MLLPSSLIILLLNCILTNVLGQSDWESCSGGQFDGPLLSIHEPIFRLARCESLDHLPIQYLEHNITQAEVAIEQEQVNNRDSQFDLITLAFLTSIEIRGSLQGRTEDVQIATDISNRLAARRAMSPELQNLLYEAKKATEEAGSEISKSDTISVYHYILENMSQQNKQMSSQASLAFKMYKLWTSCTETDDVKYCKDNCLNLQNSG